MSIGFGFDGSKIGFDGIGVYYGCYVFLRGDFRVLPLGVL